MADCIHEMPREWCAICTGRRDAAVEALINDHSYSGHHAADDVEMPDRCVPFVAQLTGRCTRDCGMAVRPGDRIVQTDDGYAHADCILS